MIQFEIAAVARRNADALLADGDLEVVAVEMGRESRSSDQDFSCAVLEASQYWATQRNEARKTT